MKKTVIATLLMSMVLLTAHRAIQGQSGLEVIAHDCHLSSRSPAGSVHLNTDPFEPARAATQLQQDRADTVRSNEQLKRQGLPQQPMPTTAVGRPTETPSRYPTGTGTVYLYRADVRNTSAKRVSSIVWEYVFVDKSNNAEAARHKFTSKVRIGPGHVATVHAKGAFSPVAVVNSANAGADSFDENVDITEVTYADGTVWRKSPK